MAARNDMSGKGVLFAAVATLALLTGGCAVWTGSAFEDKDAVPAHTVVEAPKQPAGDGHGAVDEKRSVRIKRRSAGPPPRDYVLGPDDTLYVDVYGKPGMGSPIIAGGGGKAIGTRVDGNGNIQLPMVGILHVAGLTRSQAQKKIQKAFAKYISDPWVVVEMLDHRSQPVYLIGRFEKPGVRYRERPTNVMQAIALGGGMKSDAYLQGARLMRDKRVLPVDIYDLLERGDFDQNVWLRPGDTIYVPDSRELKVFVLGDVEVPGPVDMVKGKLTLTGALSAAEGFENVGSNLEQVRIIRSLSPTRGELITVNLRKILNGEALPYPLKPGDVVFIPRSRLGRWNDTLEELLPSLQTVSSLLQPFVQLLVITDDDD